MLGFSIIELSGLIGISVIMSFGFLWLVGRSGRVERRASREAATPDSRCAHFLFEDETLADSDVPVQAIAARNAAEMQTWTDMSDWLGGRFGQLPKQLSDIGTDENVNYAATAPDDCATLTIVGLGSAHRVILSDAKISDATEKHRAHMVEQALSQNMAALNDAPCAICMLDKTGQTLWQNELFRTFSAEEAEEIRKASTKTLVSDRVLLKSESPDQDRHFELRKSVQTNCEILYASDVTKVVQAERVRREFVQTLTKTFANLTTGLAVFDRHRHLALFNPALVDLTFLPAVFLSGRPSLHQFFDRLRDHKVLPEPKNYNDWRTQIDSMIASASDGLYLEDWYLPAGLTYRVTGRPHPDGAIAFLLEDISDEITLTRRFRSQLDLHMSIFQTLDTAIAVLGPNNLLVMCNSTCSDLLSIDPGNCFSEMSASDFFSACQQKLPDDMIWGAVAKAVQERRPDRFEISGSSRMVRHCTVRPLPGQSVLITLSTAGQGARPDVQEVSA